MDNGLEICAAVYGKDEDLVLIPLPVDERSRLALEYATANSLPYCGIMGFDGECHAKCEPGMEATLTMLSAAVPFARWVCAKIQESQVTSEFATRPMCA
jgi:hypothetical protein